MECIKSLSIKNTVERIFAKPLKHKKAEVLQSSALVCEIEPLLPSVGSFSRWLHDWFADH